MELSDQELETIRKVVRSVDYGSVTINISASSDNLDLSVQNRIRHKREPEKEKSPKKAKVLKRT